jgi:hypothetical protein
MVCVCVCAGEGGELQWLAEMRSFIYQQALRPCRWGVDGPKQAEVGVWCVCVHVF